MTRRYAETRPEALREAITQSFEGGGNLIDVDGLFLRSEGEPTDDAAYNMTYPHVRHT